MSQTSIHTLCNTLGFADGHGYCPTALPEVTLFRAAGHEMACPLLYESGLGFMLQGYKRGSAAGQEFSTGGDRYLILSNNLSIRCETLATSTEPVLGIHVAIDAQELQRLVSVLASNVDSNAPPPPLERALVSAEITDDIRDAVNDLIELLHDPLRCQALGPAVLTRLYFSVLVSEDGRVLQSLVRDDSKLARISAAMRHMEGHLDTKISMEELAKLANMSRSAFHRAFKEVAGESPLQYLKTLRLNTARNRITYEGQPVNLAARSVGYESATQFSREFKRYFGLPPSRASELPYANLQVAA